MPRHLLLGVLFRSLEGSKIARPIRSSESHELFTCELFLQNKGFFTNQKDDFK